MPHGHHLIVVLRSRLTPYESGYERTDVVLCSFVGQSNKCCEQWNASIRDFI